MCFEYYNLPDSEADAVEQGRSGPFSRADVIVKGAEEPLSHK